MFIEQLVTLDIRVERWAGWFGQGIVLYYKLSVEKLVGDCTCGNVKLDDWNKRNSSILKETLLIWLRVVDSCVFIFSNWAWRALENDAKAK